MTLLHPYLLPLALLVPVALLARRRSPGVLFGPGAAELPRSWRVRLLPLPPALEVLGLLLVVYALARPVERVPLPHGTEGIDIVLCLDTSSSMTANDMDPERTRLDVAKDAAALFITGRPDDRIGLISFARYPDLRCPPTLDHDALRAILAGVEPVAGDSREDATGIGTAVARAAQVLRGGVVILLTDGEENVAIAGKPDEIAPVHAGQLCRRLGVRVYAISAGLESGKVDKSQIRGLAHGTGGRFFEARDAGAVGGVYNEIDRLEKIEIEQPRYRYEERFLPYLFVALLLLLAGRLLQSTVLAVVP